MDKTIVMLKMFAIQTKFIISFSRVVTMPICNLSGYCFVIITADGWVCVQQPAARAAPITKEL